MAEGGRLVVVSNRLPVAVSRGPDGSWRTSPGTGGLVSALAGLRRTTSFVWIGWPGFEVPAADARSLEDALADGDAPCVPVFLDAATADAYYNGFANGTLWPLLHYLPRGVSFDAAHWAAYLSANASFAAAVKRVARPGDAVWVHDYHLMALPAMLRGLGVRVGFFLHTPFPSSEVYRALPVRREVLRGVLDGADVVGFHTPDYARHFLAAAARLCGVETRPAAAVMEDGAVVRVGVYPIGIEPEAFISAVSDPAVQARVSSLLALRRAVYAAGVHEPRADSSNSAESTPRGDSKPSADSSNRADSTPSTESTSRGDSSNSEEPCGADELPSAAPILLGVDRLDYIKGLPHKLRAFERMLETHPAAVGRVSLVQVAVPTRTDVPEYRALREGVERLVGRINGRWGTPAWTPVHYLFRSVSFRELVALYRAADVLVVSSTRDGMNLVSHEWVAAHAGRGAPGALLLSEFAGAAQSLGGAALIANPWDADDLAAGMWAALRRAASPDEARPAHARMLRYVSRHTAAHWGASFVSALRRARPRPGGETPAAAPARWSPGAADVRALIVDWDAAFLVASARRARLHAAFLVALVRDAAAHRPPAESVLARPAAGADVRPALLRLRGLSSAVGDLHFSPGGLGEGERALRLDQRAPRGSVDDMALWRHARPGGAGERSAADISAAGGYGMESLSAGRGSAGYGYAGGLYGQPNFVSPRGSANGSAGGVYASANLVSPRDGTTTVGGHGIPSQVPPRGNADGPTTISGHGLSSQVPPRGNADGATHSSGYGPANLVSPRDSSSGSAIAFAVPSRASHRSSSESSGASTSTAGGADDRTPSHGQAQTVGASPMAAALSSADGRAAALRFGANGGLLSAAAAGDSVSDGRTPSAGADELRRRPSDASARSTASGDGTHGLVVIVASRLSRGALETLFPPGCGVGLVAENGVYVRLPAHPRVPRASSLTWQPLSAIAGFNSPGGRRVSTGSASGSSSSGSSADSAVAAHSRTLLPLLAYYAQHTPGAALLPGTDATLSWSFAGADAEFGAFQAADLAEDVAKALRVAAGDADAAVDVRVAPGHVDIVPRGVSKAAAASAVLRALYGARRPGVAALGDGATPPELFAAADVSVGVVCGASGRHCGAASHVFDATDVGDAPGANVLEAMGLRALARPQ